MSILLCPSMMCADFSNLKKETQELDQAGIDIFHMDFMDGSFVPNFGMGLQDFELVRSVTEKPVDVHLMIQEPSKYVEKFADLGADIIYIHPEADQQAARTLDIIHQKGKKAGIAINPGTSVEMVQGLLPLVDYVMVMTVNPGFAGQKYLEYTDSKIEKLLALTNEYHFDVMVDGAISPEKVQQLSKIGVKGFVLGTSALFGKTSTYQETLGKLRAGE
ncbi:ribulose-phosphate 3-epimerase [Enterococcus ureilyticus]|nr:ribulose-phosphate 3-epimerase [Enterococcus ureilyticus]MBM7689043.1 ribulose-phosphate 3-epimerase [Enterococcus ureilyticus]